MVEVLALEVNLWALAIGTAIVGGEALRKVEGAGATHIVLQ
jgi:hypothetical protein